MIGIIIQARMASTRLPGKILKKIADETVLEYLCKRLQYCNNIDKLIVATTTESQDDVIVDLLKEQNIDFFRGSESNVLNRYYETAKAYNIKTIVRITSDCPIIDPEVVENLVSLFKRNSWDYIYNNDLNQLPHGMDIQIFTIDALEEANSKAVEQEDLEHVVPYLENNRFRIGHWMPEKQYPCYRLTLDYPEDFDVISDIVCYFFPRRDFSLEEIVCYLDSNPEVALPNKKYL
ncbi:MAG: glycosyltransferase family protein [Candidatus Brocadiales bacterium]|nr:glycosyltransferase family protein [Candidatus Brocadiales bacterium]